jgi:hypothetical protein
MRIILVLALAATCGGCATVIRGTTDQVGFNSTPSGAEVHTSNGLACVTPCTLTVKKNEEFVATFVKPGFQTQDVPVARVVVGAGVASTAGNVIAGGLVGIGVDAITGAGYDHVPNPVNVVLAPDAPAHSPGGKPSKKPATAAPAAPPSPPPSNS